MNQLQTPNEKLLEFIKETITKFNTNEYYLLVENLSERCICAKLSYYLQNSLKNTPWHEYNVDVEYNRSPHKNNSIKSMDKNNIVVDLIIHKRGTNDNLVCIEMKKTCSNQKLQNDLNRLRKLTHPSYCFNYQLGIMILIKNKPNELTIYQVFHNTQQSTVNNLF